jgi:hypothetical protein
MNYLEIVGFPANTDMYSCRKAGRKHFRGSLLAGAAALPWQGVGSV